MKLLLLAATAVGGYLFATQTKTGKELLATSGALTPARAAIHGHLMGAEVNPDKLQKAAGLFAREGLEFEAQQLSEKAAAVGPQMQASVDLCERARSGDQNAMAMIAACREQADKGSLRARLTCQCIAWYCNAHPVPDDGAQQAEA